MFPVQSILSLEVFGINQTSFQIISEIDFGKNIVDLSFLPNILVFHPKLYNSP